MTHSLRIIFLLPFMLFMSQTLLSQESDKLLWPISQDSEKYCAQKTSSGWFVDVEGCESNRDTYQAVWTNECKRKKLDLLCCVQNADSTWNCEYFERVKSRKTVSVGSCNATGKILKFERFHGSKDIIFPTNEEVNLHYRL